MRFDILATLAALASTALAASSNVTYVTETLTAYTTYCPGPTTFAHGGTTYTITSASTVTLSCPCTVTKPVYTSTATSCSTCAPVAPAKPTTPVAPFANSTGPAPSKISGTASSSIGAAPVTTFTGGASRMVGAGASLAGVFGAAVLLL